MKTNIITPRAIETLQTEALIIPLIEGKIEASTPLPESIQTEIKHHINTGDLKAKAGSRLLFYPRIKNIKRIILWELGKRDEVLTTLREGVSFYKQLTTYFSAAFLIPKNTEAIFISEIYSRIIIASFNHTHHKSKPEKNEAILEEITFISAKKLDHFITEAEKIAESIKLIKELSLHPANHLTPTEFARACKIVAEKTNLQFTAFGPTELKDQGFGGVLGISKGSHEEPRFIELIWNPKGKKTIVLVGKGITFDSGGISLKPSRDMHEMKYDMMGGAYVLALLNLAAFYKLPYKIVGLIAASENLPGGGAIKPGDIITQYGGTTVEILNTDAEGRIILADALAYGQAIHKPNLLLDFATLTGAVIVSLGGKIGGCFTNFPKLQANFLKVAEHNAEFFHFLPLHTGYTSELKSKVADIANIGKGKHDAIIAALFLNAFISPSTPWIHFDIAGIAWDNEGPTGTGLRTFIEYLRNLKL